MTQRRLIEEAFPLKKVSEDSKHEKNVRHGHISTLHIWPARRPLAACRAALIATLLPDPFGRVLACATGAVHIKASAVMAASVG
jgi:adenine-specific DNA methylase